MSVPEYVPCLWWKRGEQQALRDLAPATKPRVFPLIQVPPIPIDWDSGSPTKTLDNHIDKVPDQVFKYWGTAPIAVDAEEGLDPTDRMATTQHPAEWLFDEFRIRNCAAVPVISSTSDAALESAVRRICSVDRRGAVLRVDVDTFYGPTLAADIAAKLAAIGLAAADVDLVIDLGDVAGAPVSGSAAAVNSTWPALPHVGVWRTTTLLLAAFPASLAGIPRGVSRKPRTDWAVYQACSSTGARFGDYAISNPELIEVDPRLMRQSASVRYTGGSEWLVVKGKGVRKVGWSQTTGLCQQLMAEPEYCGPPFSTGDQFIADVAAGLGGPGNATTWRQVATNHHIELVVYQVGGGVLTATPGVP